MKTCLLIFPHQLFAEHPGFELNPDCVAMVEDTLFFGDEQYPCNFHKQKLVLHRASMQAFADDLSNQNVELSYFNYANQTSDLAKVCKTLVKQAIGHVICCDVVDFILQKRLLKLADQHGLSIQWLPTPCFLNQTEDNQRYRASKNRWFMADFYQHQRKRLQILLDDEQKPLGGRWSFDEENRKKIPKKALQEIPQLDFPAESQYILDAKAYVETHIPNALGKVDQAYYPINHKEAEGWLEAFLVQRFALFGPYEDAIVEDQNWLYHSVLTPMLNIGLLTPAHVVERTLDFAKEHDIELASVEGFIRQIIGWREFMRATYVGLGVTMRTTNHWQHTRPMPKAFYDGTTGIVPVDNTIKRILTTGYCHHIERLMVLGGFMFLCEIDPNDIYRWFMELFIDSYDWVMVTNVYAMSQNADGGLITTKPYFSGSNYVRKMSHYPKGDWCDAWDGLYWRWILQHKDALRKNPRWAMMVRTGEKMNKEKQQVHIRNAEDFLNSL